MRHHGVLHLHSSYSYDAKCTLQDLKEILQDAGASFALMTEHTDEMTAERARAFVAECAALSDQSFIFVPGFEISHHDTHVLAPGCETFISQHATPAEFALWRKAAPLMILAHPHRNGYETRAPAGYLDGIEIWNAQYDGKVVPRNGARRLFVREKSKRADLRAFAGWDFHRSAHSGGPMLAVEIDALTAHHVLKALRDGAFTLRSGLVEVGSDGVLRSGDERFVGLLSFVYVHIIRTAKAINRVLSWFGLKLPARLVARVRSRL